jgi:hypothetical protein
MWQKNKTKQLTPLPGKKNNKVYCKLIKDQRQYNTYIHGSAIIKLPI